MNNSQQEIFFSNINDYTAHLRWLFLITKDDTQLKSDDIVSFMESLYDQLGKYDKGTEEFKKTFINDGLSEFLKYEEYAINQQDMFELSDYVDPKGKLLVEIRNALSSLSTKEDKERFLLSVIVQIKDSSNLLFKSGEYNFSIRRGKNNTSVCCEFMANTDICGINLVNNDKIISTTKDAMCFLFQIVDAFSAIIDTVCLENNFSTSVLSQKAGVVLCERDIDKISNLIGSEELTRHYINNGNLYNGLSKELRDNGFISDATDEILSHIIKYKNLPIGTDKIIWKGKPVDAVRFCDYFGVNITSEWNKCFELCDGKKLKHSHRNKGGDNDVVFKEEDGRCTINVILSKYPNSQI